MFRTPRRLAVSLVVVTVVAIAPLPVASAAFAAGDHSARAPETAATLKVTSDKVEVKKSGAKKFKVAKDGAQLHQGDTVRTDANGLAEIDYDEDTYTRLDVHTTFTIKKLTNEKGDRQVQGSLDTGQTWNRTAALTESGSFEQEAAGANATTRGTVFTVQCDAPDHCTYIAIDHDTGLEGANGESHVLTPHVSCDSTSGKLCDETRTLSIDELAANSWIQSNLIRDLTERGVGTGPFVPTNVTLTVVNGEIVSVTPGPPPVPPPGSPPVPPAAPLTTTPTPTPTPVVPPAPVIDAHPVNVTSLGSDPTPGQATGPNTHVVSQDERNDVTFTLRVTNPAGGTYWIVFLDLPLATFGQIKAAATPVDLTTHYDPATVFTFVPVQTEPGHDCTGQTFADCFADYPDSVDAPIAQGPVTGSVEWSDTFTFKAENDQGGVTVSDPVALVAVDDICTSAAEGPRPGLPGTIVACPGI